MAPTSDPPRPTGIAGRGSLPAGQRLPCAVDALSDLPSIDHRSPLARPRSLPSRHAAARQGALIVALDMTDRLVAPVVPRRTGRATDAGRPPVAIAHDYLTQRGGAERVVLSSMLAAFPGAPLHTSLYEPGATYPEFANHDVHTSPLDRIGPLRRHHRYGLPVYAPTFSRMRVDADAVLCSSSGWAHTVRTERRKVVYCYAPAHWLYQPQCYTGGSRVAGLAASTLGRPLRRLDRKAAATPDHYLTSSIAVRDAIRTAYGIDAEVLPPPHRADVSASQTPVVGIEPGFLLCVARLLPYKNVDVVVEALARRPQDRLVVVGDGPERCRLQKAAGPNVTFAGTVTDAELRWLYATSRAFVAASFEDYGLSPLEAAAFAKPTVALRAGGYFDTIVEDETGVFFNAPLPASVAHALTRLADRPWNDHRILAHAASFGEPAFCARPAALANRTSPPAAGRGPVRLAGPAESAPAASNLCTGADRS